MSEENNEGLQLIAEMNREALTVIANNCNKLTQHILDLKEANDSFSDFFDIIEEKIDEVINDNYPYYKYKIEDLGLDAKIELLGKCIKSQRDAASSYIKYLQREYMVPALEKQQQKVQDDLDTLQQKCDNPELDKMPKNAYAGPSTDRIEYKEKLPITQCRVLCNGVRDTDLEDKVKTLLSQSGVEYADNDDFVAKVLRVLDKFSN